MLLTIIGSRCGVILLLICELIQLLKRWVDLFFRVVLLVRTFSQYLINLGLKYVQGFLSLIDGLLMLLPCIFQGQDLRDRLMLIIGCSLGLGYLRGISGRSLHLLLLSICVTRLIDGFDLGILILIHLTCVRGFRFNWLV